MMKFEYVIPELEIIEFDVEDIVTSSPSGGGLNNGGILGTEDDSIDAGELFPRQLDKKKGIIKLLEGLPNFLRVSREGLPNFRYKLMRVLREGLV